MALVFGDDDFPSDIGRRHKVAKLVNVIQALMSGEAPEMEEYGFFGEPSYLSIRKNLFELLCISSVVMPGKSIYEELHVPKPLKLL